MLTKLDISSCNAKRLQHCTFLLIDPTKQHVFLEFLVENKVFCSTERLLRADNARNKWLK